MAATQTEIRYRIPKLHNGGKVVYEHPARFKFLAAGRRWRKTTLAMRVALSRAARGAQVVWGAPVYRQCMMGWDECQKAAGGVADFRKSEMQIVCPPMNGAISFVSLDTPDNARGKTADLVIVDEAGFVQEMAWHQVLRPMLSDTGGAALIMGTPKGHNWFWREHMGAMDRSDSVAWQVPTLGVAIQEGQLVRSPHSMENPDFEFEEAERMFQSMPQRTFEQEFLAAFIDDAGAVFRNVLAVSTAQPLSALEPGHHYVMGLDWAKSYDWTVASVIDAVTKQQVTLDRFNRVDYQFQLGRVKALAEQWQPSAIWAETNAMGEPLVDALRREGLPMRGFTTTATSKQAIIEALALAIEKGAITLLNNEIQKAELQAYDMQRLPGGGYRYGAPDGMHDDTVMALAIAWQGVSLPSRPIFRAV